MKLRKTTVAAVSGLAILAAIALSGCGVQQTAAAGASSTPTACTGSSDDKAADPTQLTLALVPSGDAKKLVETVKPLEEALTQRLGIPVKGVITQDYQAAVEAFKKEQA